MTGTEARLLSELLFIPSASLGRMCPQQSDEGQSLFGFSSTEIGGTEDSACASVPGGKEGDGAVAAGEKGFTAYSGGRNSLFLC